MSPDAIIQIARVEIENAACKTRIPADQLYLTGGAITRWRYDLPQADLDFIAAHEPKFDAEVLVGASCVTPRAWSFGRYQILRYKFGAPPDSICWFDLEHCRSWVSMRDYYFTPQLESRTVCFCGTSLDYIATLGRMVKWLNLGFTMEKVHLIPVIAAIREIPKELNVDILGALNLTSTGEESLK